MGLAIPADGYVLQQNLLYVTSPEGKQLVELHVFKGVVLHPWQTMSWVDHQGQNKKSPVGSDQRSISSSFLYLMVISHLLPGSHKAGAKAIGLPNC